MILDLDAVLGVLVVGDTDLTVAECMWTCGVTWIDPTSLVETTATMSGIAVVVLPVICSGASAVAVSGTMAPAHGSAVGTAKSDDVGSVSS